MGFKSIEFEDMNIILKKIYEDLKIQQVHITNCKLALCEESPLKNLEIVDIDFEGKPFILSKATAIAWQNMSQAAKTDEVILEPFSGFRSYLYQKQLIVRKLAKGKSLEVIFTETAIPGFSEHHSGRAVDICTDGKYELSEDFEKTRAYDWLTENAGQFNFKLSYPRHNSQGIVFEPWHWYFEG